MIPKLVSDLHAIAAKPNSTPGTLLIVTKRTCRILLQTRDEIWHERRAFLRKTRKAKHDLPYSALDIKKLEARAETHRDDEYRYVRARVVQLANAMSSDASGVAKALGFDRLCDILNVNPVHRMDARIDGGKTLRGLIFEARVEDSADVRNSTWAGGPLCEAFYAAYCDELLQKTVRRMDTQSEPQQASDWSVGAASPGAPLTVFEAASVMIH
jgi:hypothetical protein